MAALDGMAQGAARPREGTEAPLPIGLCLGFGVGTIGVSIVLNTISVYFPALMTTVLGVPPVIAGALLTASKAYDFFADLVIGGVSDRAHSRMGRRRPFLLAGAAVSSLSLLMIFCAPKLGGTALIAYMGAALVIYSTGYSLFNVPYLAMPGEMTDGYDERVRLIAYRTAFVGVGQLFSLAATAALIQAGGGGGAGYRLMGMVMALLAAFTMVLSFFGTAGARVAERTSHGRITLDQVKSLASNRPLVLLMGAKLTQYTAFGVMQPANLLFLLNVAKTGYGGMIQYSLAQNIAVFASMPLWSPLARAIGKRDAYLLAIITMIVASLSWLTVTAGVPVWQIWARAVLFGVGSGGSLLMSTSMLPDTMEYDRLRTGLRREGVFSSFYSVNEKLGFALGAMILGAALSAGGYVATTNGHLVTQSAGAVASLYAVKALAPSAILLLGMGMIWFYRLDQKTLRHAADRPGL